MDCTEQDHFLITTNVWDKLARVESDLTAVLNDRPLMKTPVSPGRDLIMMAPEDLPKKKGFATNEGQARLLHDLASIELQALELGMRTLLEFPEAPHEFRHELAVVTASEGNHLRLCLEALEALGRPWGTWPAHQGLWGAVSVHDSLLDRILIVHRYLEGSGLDAGDGILKRLTGVTAGRTHKVVQQIVREEVGHVEFGSRWYRRICRDQGLDPADDFPKRFGSLLHQIPKRIEKIAGDLRRQAGFTDAEISFLEDHRISIQRAHAQQLG